MIKEEFEKRVHEFAVQIYKEGFEEGREDAEMDTKTRVEGAYEKGLKDAWECARKILDAGVPYDYWDMGSGHHISYAIKRYSASEATQKIKEYERQKQKCESCFTKKLTEEKWVSVEDCKKCTKEISAKCVVDGCEFEPKQTDVTDSDEIKVGDEIVDDQGRKVIVTQLLKFKDILKGFDDEGCPCNAIIPKIWHKTGRHFYAIEYVLEELRKNKKGDEEK